MPTAARQQAPEWGHFHNVHATGWCSSVHAGRQAAIASVERGRFWRPEGHPQGPVVARVRVKHHPIAQAILNANYALDAFERGVLYQEEMFLLSRRNGLAFRYIVRLTAKRQAALLADARARLESARTRPMRNSIRRAIESLEAMEGRFFPH